LTTASEVPAFAGTTKWDAGKLQSSFNLTTAPKRGRDQVANRPSGCHRYRPGGVFPAGVICASLDLRAGVEQIPSGSVVLTGLWSFSSFSTRYLALWAAPCVRRTIGYAPVATGQGVAPQFLARNPPHFEEPAKKASRCRTRNCLTLDHNRWILPVFRSALPRRRLRGTRRFFPGETVPL